MVDFLAVEKQDRVFGESIDRWGCRATVSVGPDMIRPRGVDRDQDQIGSRRRCLCVLTALGSPGNCEKQEYGRQQQDDVMRRELRRFGVHWRVPSGRAVLEVYDGALMSEWG
jgi:hypothetical protein